MGVALLGSWGCGTEGGLDGLEMSAKTPLVSHQLDTSGLCEDEESGFPPASKIPPSCFEGCALDATEAWGFDPACELTQLILSDAVGAFFHSTTMIPRCDELPAEDPANEAGVCYRALTGAAMSPVCIDEGWNLEFTITRDPNAPAPPCGTLIVATCEAIAAGPDGCAGIGP